MLGEVKERQDEWLVGSDVELVQLTIFTHIASTLCYANVWVEQSLLASPLSRKRERGRG